MSDANSPSEKEPVYSAFADDPDFAELLELFAENMGTSRQNLQDAYEAGGIDELRKLAHQLKGSGGGYGFDGLTELAAGLEEACKTNDVEDVCTRLNRVLDYIDRITV